MNPVGYANRSMLQGNQRNPVSRRVEKHCESSTQALKYLLVTVYGEIDQLSTMIL